MESVPRLIVIDACDTPNAFAGLAGDEPPVVTSLRSLDAQDCCNEHAPVIVCHADDSARARGAFIATGDSDGRVIAVDPVGSQALRRALFADQDGPIIYLAAGQVFDDPFSDWPLIGALPAIPVRPARLRGVWDPDPHLWRDLCRAYRSDKHGD